MFHSTPRSCLAAAIFAGRIVKTPVFMSEPRVRTH
jgi:hypothetical protein